MFPRAILSEALSKKYLVQSDVDYRVTTETLTSLKREATAMDALWCYFLKARASLLSDHSQKL